MGRDLIQKDHTPRRPATGRWPRDVIRCPPQNRNSHPGEMFKVEKALRAWLDSHGLLAITLAVGGIIVTLAVALVLGGFWLARP